MSGELKMSHVEKSVCDGCKVNCCKCFTLPFGPEGFVTGEYSNEDTALIQRVYG
jgi:hypothetical protein